MLDLQPIRRVRPEGDPGLVTRTLADWRTPTVFEEADSEVFQAFRDRWSDDSLNRLFADQSLQVRHFPDPASAGAPEVGRPVEREMQAAEFLSRIRAPAQSETYYARLSAGNPSHAGFEPLFEATRALSAGLSTLSQGDHLLDTLWLGGAGNVTPLHHDPVSRLHGTLRGRKSFVLFPPDRRHRKLLQVLPWRTVRRRHSRIGLGPLDPRKFPDLEKARGVETVCEEGDFLYIPPCWWHYVTIPSELTITTSVAYRPPELYRTWAFWRLRLGSLLGEGTP